MTRSMLNSVLFYLTLLVNYRWR